MNWQYNNRVQEHQLCFQKSVLARIQTSRTPKGRFIVRSLVSGIYYGLRRQEKLEKQNKEWVCCRKKFPDKDRSAAYIKRKKEEILRFIKAREKEV